ncbi:3-oxoacyl-(acyl-carrier-protein) reductase [Pseudonocardia dioxanivorans CB1190]|jgi:NAD(P)-dependent dehydrogenase (short-subunit alcohol dehydrogenase family)|uniref:3-oxoacyl-(Acyl-carrier-protein) reductase n=1 Tax=Pseudonocardia dioxanivorans (strain ATCC 55486 / DSM 44775 / JCM 13855 / CB1190) TaxID=675635 RepID=F4CNX9_PSEUX|nr:SDR family oxidoreductase [Pseudonocardia dioxanivorans]AEA22784.1 3-oxoacyl-(acyl-carrier-protein) reductase [Pseudonocardia dioxanivorans CB1190]
MTSSEGSATSRPQPRSVADAVAAARAVEKPLAGRTALVTGGSRGLGREIAIAFAAAGADVAVVSRKKDACEALAEELSDATGQKVTAHGAHVADWERVGTLLDEVEAELGVVDVLVNNAGMAPMYPSLDEVTELLWDKVIGVNLKGPFRFMAAAGKRMVAAGGGVMLNISSIASIRPTANDLPYAAAKAGLNVLTKGFAQEYGPTVRVNTILAGPFFTDISAGWDMDYFDRLTADWPQSRGGDPAEIVGAALYLCGPTAGFTTGTLLAVDGGGTAAP